MIGQYLWIGHADPDGMAWHDRRGIAACRQKPRITGQHGLGARAGGLVCPGLGRGRVAHADGSQIGAEHAVEQRGACPCPVARHADPVNRDRRSGRAQHIGGLGHLQAKVEVGIGKQLPAADHRQIGTARGLHPAGAQRRQHLAQTPDHQALTQPEWQRRQHRQRGRAVAQGLRPKAVAPREIDVIDVHTRLCPAQFMRQTFGNHPVADIRTVGQPENHNPHVLPLRCSAPRGFKARGPAR